MNDLNNIVNSLVRFNQRQQALDLINTFASRFTDHSSLLSYSKIYFSIKEYDLAYDFAFKAVYMAFSEEKEKETYLHLATCANYSAKPNIALEFLVRLSTKEYEIPLTFDFKFLMKMQEIMSWKLLGEHDRADGMIFALETEDLNEEQKKAVHFSKFSFYLRHGNTLKGLDCLFNYCDEKDRKTLPFKRWKGEELNNKLLILLARTGIGDEIVSFRFLKYLKHKNYVWLSRSTDMAKLITSCGYTADTNLDHYLEKYDEDDIVWCDAEHIPLLLNIDNDKLWYGPYIKSNKKEINKSKPKIGLRWEGNFDYPSEYLRKSDLKTLVESCPINAELYSLQRDTGLYQLDKFPSVIPLHNTLTSIDSLIQEIEKLDLVVTTCTSVAHVSAAMGKPTIVLVSFLPNYTWETSYWYGENVVTIKQQILGKWDTTLINNKIIELLENHV